MLLQLHIENFALVDQLTLEFDPHLNVLTGETGAGKSILIDAIRFALGERADQVRFHATGKSCSVEAVFEVPAKIRKQNELFDSFISEEDDLFILRREYQPQGKSKFWINNRLTNASTLKELGSYLLDIHGQYDHQLLFDKKSHLEIIDRLGKSEDLLEEYQVLFKDYQKLLKRQRELHNLEEGRERELDLLKYQIEELENANVKPDEEEELATERVRLANSEKLYEFASQALKALDENDISASSLLGSASRDFEGLVRLDESLGELKGNFENAQLQMEEAIRELRDYQESLSFDPDRLVEIDQRLDQLELIKRKYGGSLQSATEFLIEAKGKFDTLENSGLYEKEVEQKIKAAKPKLEALTKKLTEKRKKTGTSLKKIVEQELGDLKIQDAQFECQIQKVDFNEWGSDEVEFLMSLNAGQPVRELRKIVSGGEVSRVMLAMKKALMKVDPVPTLIFDEIDANIGGRLGTVTGEKLKEIAGARQVLLVTHLPQIASFADRHFKVSKGNQKGKTIAKYTIVDGQQRVDELSAMMSGQDETEISKKHAEEMLKRVKA